jgi:hypothetical protein
MGANPEGESDTQYRRTDAWHFEKRISFDTVAAVVGMLLLVAGPVVYWGRGLEEANRLTETRVKIVEVVQEQLLKQFQALAVDARDQRIAILARMDAMDIQITQLRVDIAKAGIPERRIK